MKNEKNWCQCSLQFYLEKITLTYYINSKGEWVVGHLVATLAAVFFLLLKTSYLEALSSNR